MTAYWGGYTEHGELLHLAVESEGQYARSACGLVLTGGAFNVPAEHRSAQCRRCTRAATVVPAADTAIEDETDG